MQNRRIHTLCLSALCLAMLSGSTLAQKKPEPPAPPPSPAKPGPPTLPGPPPLVAPPTNPLLTPDKPPTPAVPRTFYYSVIPFETLEPALQLAPDQSAKIKPIYEHLDAETMTLHLAAKTPEEKRAAAEKIRKAQTDANTQIGEALTDDQKNKAKDLMFEMVKMASIGVSPQMLKELKLTPDQRKQIMALVDIVQAKLNALPRTDRRGKYNALAAVERVKIPALLTEPQKAVFNKYNDQGRPKSETAILPGPVAVDPVKSPTDKPPTPPAPNPLGDPIKK